ncbi:MAG TPA: endospore germination permease [Negativicutes bacterium]|nr:endospore germination permease [Negativicutes bacterium]
MQNKNECTITSKQLIFIMIGAMLGSGILSLPRLAAKDAGQDAWLAVILGSLFPLISLSLVRALYKNNSAGSYVDICKRICGKYVGNFLSLLLASYSVVTAAVLLRIFIEVVSMFLLRQTPVPVKLMLMLSVCAYLASQNPQVLGRVNEFLFYILLPLLFFSLPAIVKNSDWLNLMPVFNHRPADYFRASLTTGLAFSGFELYIVFHPYVSREQEAFRASLYGLLVTLAIYLYFVIGALMVFGNELIQKITWPTLRMLATTEIPVIERLEFMFIQAWIGVSFRPISNQYFCASHIITEVFNLKAQKKGTMILFPVITAIAFYPSDIFQVFKISDYVGYSALIIGIGLPLLLVIIGMLSRVMGGDKSEAEK